MSIGEPQQTVTKLLTDSVSRYNEEWQFYPKPTGTPRFIQAVEKYIAKRWPDADGLVESTQIIPVPGTREPLHLLGHIIAGGKKCCCPGHKPFLSCMAGRCPSER